MHTLAPLCAVDVELHWRIKIPTVRCEKELNIVNTAFKVESSMMTEDRMDKMETNIGALQKDVSALQKDVGALQKDVSGLQKDVSTLQGSVGELRTDVKTLSVYLCESIVANAKDFGLSNRTWKEALDRSRQPSSRQNCGC